MLSQQVSLGNSIPHILMAPKTVSSIPWPRGSHRHEPHVSLAVRRTPLLSELRHQNPPVGSRTVDNMEDVILPRPDIMSTFNPATNTLIIKVLTHTYQQMSMVLGHLLVVGLNP
jgi:hypothetical protein